jgi:hypothetical protein
LPGSSGAPAALQAFGVEGIEGDNIGTIVAPRRIVRIVGKVVPAFSFVPAHRADALQVGQQRLAFADRSKSARR